MAHHTVVVSSDLWFVAYTESRGVVHYGLAAAPATITTGQENIETFATEAELEARVNEIKGPGWYAPTDNNSIDPVSNVT